MNVFDFDKTLYCGDSTVDFWIYVLHNEPSCLRDIPLQAMSALMYGLGCLSKGDFKESFYRFLKRLDDPATLVEAFWERALNKMNKEVLAYACEGDLVVSASPRFLIEIPCMKYGLKLIASEVDICSGHLLGPNCYGSEKVKRIAEEGYPLHYAKGFSDSKSDAPLLILAEEAYVVTAKGLRAISFEDKAEEKRASNG